MTMNAFHSLNALLVLLVLLCMKTSSFGSKDGKHMTMRCIEREREALLLFRRSVANANDHLDSWNEEQEEDCCKWKGVGCDNSTAHVTHLLLSSLLSPSPPYWGSYTNRVTIGHSLLDLPYLTYLDLSSNQIEIIPDFIGSFKKLLHLDFSNTTAAGGSFPSQIDNISNLQYLDLSFNNFDGPIPKSIGSLNSLRYLDLSGNRLTGVIPQELGNLSKLQHLDLGYNSYISGGGNFNWLFNLSSLTHLDLSWVPIDPPTIWASFIQRIPSLSVLRLVDCNLSAPSSTLSNFSSSISAIYLPDNHINSSIFEWLSHLSGSLVDLDLSMNGLEGRIPESFGYMTALTHLYLYANHLTGVLCNLSSLQVADFSHNNFNGNLDDLLSHLSSSLVKLDLSYNVLEGRIPKSFGHMTALTFLSLENNFLNGPIPPSFGHMTALTFLSLENNFLNGPIPPSFGHMTALAYLHLGRNLLTGPIPDSFALMTALSYLDLSANQLNGVIPKSFGNSSSLQVADFSSNNFTGNLEDFLSGPFPLLEDLYISENQLTGSLPDITLHSNLIGLGVHSNQLNGYLPTFFEHHSALRNLDLSNNHLRGSLPDFTGFSFLESLYLDNNEFSGSLPEFVGLSSLGFLYLDNNELSGSLPDFTGCSALQELQLGENRLTEWETQSTGLLYNLWTLDLAKNSIHSTITEAHLSNLSSLKYLDTSFNSITFEFSPKWIPPFQLWELSLASCKLGPTFPKWIRNQRDISYLDISDSQISDTIPVWFWNLSGISFLNLSSNNIRGRFSSRLINFGEIDLSSNHFDGPLPSIPENCSKINLSQNKFSGTLLSLSAFENLSLSYLDISHNELSGALPDNWMHFHGLVFLNLGFNNFSGRIPTSVGHLVSLRTLILRNNNLYGELPASLRNCSGLGFADFGLNKLSGKVPSWIGEDLPQLYGLILKSNRFYGSMPHELCYLSNLHFLDMSINMISGTIPPCVHNLTAMIKKGTEVAEHIYSAFSTTTTAISSTTDAVPPTGALITNFSYFDNALARWKGREFQYGSNFAYLKMIDLSTNNLTGEIPIGVTKLLELKGLNLSGNRFNGKVPLEIGQLKGLECLDLSTNKFSGEIPQSMSGLNFLAFLNLSNNNFLGKIPSGTQLQGFNTSTYEGNPGLCGKPLINICPGDEPADQAVLSSSDFEIDGDDSEYKRWLYISVVLGFSTTFWGIIGTLVLNRRWRHSYFLFLENLKERFYVVIIVHFRRLQRKI